MSLQSAINDLGDAAPPSDRMRPVRIWLALVALLVLLIVGVGGMTRLTDSGLSITDWKPISGAIPPLSVADWEREFEAYKQIPEFKLQNNWMNLEEFKFIFWWEWGHRQLARFIGLAFAVPLIIFLFQRRIPKAFATPLIILFFLGGFQGFLGWWMVSSGLSDRVDVSQYRLAAHLCAASVLFWAVLFVLGKMRNVLPKFTDEAHDSGQDLLFSQPLKIALAFLAVLIFAQIGMGAFVAGLDAGYGYNTWPLMDGHWVPPGLAEMDPFWRNLFENRLTVQFVHRLLAYFLVLAIAVFALWIWRAAGENHLAKQWSIALLIVTFLQVVLGIATLVLVVPIHLALTHQVVAFALFGLTALMLARATATPNALQ